MSIILPNSRFQAPELLGGTKKPAVNVQIDWQNPITEGLVGFWVFQNGIAINLVDGTIVSDTAGMTEADAETIAWDDAASTNTSFTLQSGFDFTSNATVIARVKKIGTNGWPMLFGMGSNPAATNDFAAIGYWSTGADLRTFFTSSSRVIGKSVNRGVYFTGALTADVAANEIKTYVDGQYTVTDSISSRGLDFTTIDNITLFGSGTTEADQQGLYEGDYGIVFESTKTAEEVASLYDSPYQFLIPTVGPSLIRLDGASLGITLAVQNSNQAEFIDNVGLVLQSALSVNDNVQAQTIDNIDLTASSSLSVSGTNQAEGLDNVLLSLQSFLAVSDSLQAQRLEGDFVLTQSSALAIQNITSVETLDNIDLLLQGLLSVDDTLQSESLEGGVDLSLSSVLLVNNSLQAEMLDNVELTQSSVIVINNSASIETLDNIDLLLQALLSIDNTLQNETIGSIDLSVSSVLNIQSVNQSESISGDLILIYQPSGGGSCPTAAEIAAAVWSESRAISLITDVELIRSIEEGAWVITGNQMIFYKPDNTTELMRFDLKDKAGNATESNAFERVRV